MQVLHGPQCVVAHGNTWLHHPHSCLLARLAGESDMARRSRQLGEWAVVETRGALYPLTYSHPDCSTACVYYAERVLKVRVKICPYSSVG